MTQGRNGGELLTPWKPGQSGNPSGKPKADPDTRAILKAASPDAALKLVRLLYGEDENRALKAAEIILKPTLAAMSVDVRDVVAAGLMSLSVAERVELVAGLLRKLSPDELAEVRRVLALPAPAVIDGTAERTEWDKHLDLLRAGK